MHTLDIRGCSQLSELCLMGLERAALTSTHLRCLDIRGLDVADIGLGWVAQVNKMNLSLLSKRCMNFAFSERQSNTPFRAGFARKKQDSVGPCCRRVIAQFLRQDRKCSG